jgi:hypothetical protein
MQTHEICQRIWFVDIRQVGEKIYLDACMRHTQLSMEVDINQLQDFIDKRPLIEDANPIKVTPKQNFEYVKAAEIYSLKRKMIEFCNQQKTKKNEN